MKFWVPSPPCQEPPRSREPGLLGRGPAGLLPSPSSTAGGAAKPGSPCRPRAQGFLEGGRGSPVVSGHPVPSPGLLLATCPHFFKPGLGLGPLSSVTICTSCHLWVLGEGQQSPEVLATPKSFLCCGPCQHLPPLSSTSQVLPSPRSPPVPSALPTVPQGHGEAGPGPSARPGPNLAGRHPGAPQPSLGLRRRGPQFLPGTSRLWPSALGL